MPEHNAEIENLIKTYVDKDSGKKSSTSIVYEVVRGDIPSNVAKKLKLRMPGINVNLEQLGEDLPHLEELSPYRPCVLPRSLIAALSAASSGATTDR